MKFGSITKLYMNVLYILLFLLPYEFLFSSELRELKQRVVIVRELHKDIPLVSHARLKLSPRLECMFELF